MKQKPASQAEIQAMEKDLAAMETDLQSHYSKMGKSILELAGTEQRAIDQRIDKIIQLKMRLAQSKNEVQCPECMTFNASGSYYCSHCGVPLPSLPDTPQ